VRTFKTFISSPGGLNAERMIVMDEIRALSQHQLRLGNPGISAVRWPDDIGAGVAEHPQFVIDRQTTDHDILVCLVGTRMGSATPRANSGTEGEFNRTFELILKGANIQVVLLFGNMLTRPLDIDPYQLMLVRAFQEKAGRLGVLYHTFHDHKELRRFVHESLRVAYSRLLLGKAKSRQDTSRVQKKGKSSSTTMALPDIHFRDQASAPQAADVRLIPIARYRRCEIRLTGTVNPLSPYLRFGFKYFESREPLFSSGSIQTVGQNIVVHIGRNKSNRNWFVTEYWAGSRVGPDRPLPSTSAKRIARFAFTISEEGTIIFALDHEPIYRKFLPIEGLPGLAMLAWGDENDFRCDVLDLKLHVRLRVPVVS
jgi:hypothetical protein